MALYQGTSGNDSLTGGSENDTLDGYEGNDYLVGGGGNDFLYGEDGNDTLYGGAIYSGVTPGIPVNSNDYLGNDYLNGGGGNDFLAGYMSSDTLVGGAGNDTLDGYGGNDILDGGEGNDSLYGGEGNDSLTGGQGSDRFIYGTSSVAFNSSSFGVDTLSDFVSGTDKIVLHKSTFNSISSTAGTGFSELGEFAIVTSDAEAATSAADIVYNSVNGNLFYNPNGSNPGFGTGTLLLTLAGSPTLVATDFIIEASTRYLDGADGNDSLVGEDGNDQLSGYGGNDTLLGGIGDDSLFGYAGNDYLVGGDGNDYLHGGAGNDSLVGGLGSDRFVYFSSIWTAPFNSVDFGVDVISDFVSGTDKIVLYKNDFTSISSIVGTGFSEFEEFAIVTSDADAATSTADIVYNSANGNLFYNPNGSDATFSTGGLFATLVGAPTLVATDFDINFYNP